MGSEWRKWELHVHSPASILSNRFCPEDGDDVWETYISKLEEADFAAIGVTDYFSIDGYRKVQEFKNSGRLANIDLILPNIELRLNEPADNRRINFHVIFSDEVDADDIEDHFLHELRFPKSSNPQSTDEMDKLKRDNLERLGRRIRSDNKGKYSSLNDLQIGATVATVSHKEISDLLDDERFRGKYVLVLDAGNLPPWHGQLHNIRRILTQKADFIFTSNPENIRWYLGRKGYDDPQHFKREFETFKPCIHGSDAHELFFIGHPCAKRGDKDHDCKSSTKHCELRHCWIKADPTFEGLKQLLYEPEDRVRIQAENPTPSRYPYTLSHVRFSNGHINSELRVSDTAIPLHPELVAVAGGKGAGKTAFVDLIANCFGSQLETKDENSFVGRLRKDDPDLETRICFSNGKQFTKVVMDANHLVTEPDIPYISQGKLLHFVAENSELMQRIRDLIVAEVSPGKIREYYRAVNQLKGIEQSIKDESSAIAKLEAESHESKIKTAKTEIEKNQVVKQELERRISVLSSNIQDQQALEQAQSAQDNVARLDKQHVELQKLTSLLEELKNLVADELLDYNARITSINELLRSLNFTSQQIPKIDFPSLEALDTLLNDVEDSITRTVDEMDSAQEDVARRSQDIAAISKLADEKVTAENAIQDANERLESIEESRSELQAATRRRSELFIGMLRQIRETQKKYSEMISIFESQLKSTRGKTNAQTKNVLKHLDFHASVKFDADRFMHQATNLFHNGRVDVDSHFECLLASCERFANDTDGGDDALAACIESFIEDQELRGKVKERTVNPVEAFYHLFYQNYFQIQPEVKYGQTSVDRLSLGQKATVLLKIYLAQGTSPIIVDSHDDYLDNYFIVEELIDVLRIAKEERQIILVSNNANMVVNADADQIIIAEHENNTISYVSGSIENTEIRAKALKVLEGGKEAFKRRHEKYRI